MSRRARGRSNIHASQHTPSIGKSLPWPFWEMAQQPFKYLRELLRTDANLSERYAIVYTVLSRRIFILQSPPGQPDEHSSQ